MDVLSCLFFIIIFYGMCIYSICCGDGVHKLKRLYSDFLLYQKIILVLVLFALVLFSAYWVKQDHFVYFWDYSNYWCISIERMEYMFNHSFEDILKSLLFSINNDDYNNLLPTILALPLKMVGDSFARYAFLNVLIFLIPSILVQGLIAVKVVDNFERKSMVYILALIIAALMPANYYATFRGI